MLRPDRELYDEIGPFDEWFSPAFCEDTDYWHRAWKLGVELSPVPAAHVVHARRTSSHPEADRLLQAHRYKYGWKHGVDPDRAPPYYNREIVDYEPKPKWMRVRPGPDRPRVFCIGLNKTGTSSFHAAMEILGLTSLHWGGPATNVAVRAALDEGRPLLSGLDPAFDAFSDIGLLSTHFDELDEQYPGAGSCSPCDRSTSGSTAAGATSSATCAPRAASTTGLPRGGRGPLARAVGAPARACPAPLRGAAPTSSRSTSRPATAGSRCASSSTSPSRPSPSRGRTVIGPWAAV